MKKILYLIVLCPVVLFGQTQTENYTKTTVYKVPTATSIAQPTKLEANQSVTYFDGLGRPIQKIAAKESGTGKDIILPIEYDALGRKEKSYLPYVSTGSSINYDNNGLTNVLDFYANPTPATTGSPNFEATSNPYTKTVYDASPFNRVLEQAAVGNDWDISLGHTIKKSYLFNTLSEKVIYFKAIANWNSTVGLYELASFTNNGYYADNKLYKTVVKNENWTPTNGDNKTTHKFKNSQGQLVLKRSFDNGVHDTYYVYDQFGNQSYIITPKANGAIDTVTLDNLCYQYKYDYRNRLVEKKLPGKQWEFIVYDKLNRPIATGPTFSPFANATANTVGWLITKYDAFNRPVYKGWQQGIVNTAERKNKQTSQNSLTTTLNETKQTSGTIDGIAVYYSNVVSPTTFKLLTVNYYDDYNFPITPAISFADVEGQTVYYNNSTQKPRGMPTGSWVRALGANTAIVGETAYSLYDYKARPIRSFTTNILGGYSIVDTKLDFIGKTNLTKTRHKYKASSTELLITENFVYSAQDRLLTHTHKINNLPEQLLFANFYNELGQISFKMVGNDVGLQPLQRIDYTYNIRGWIKTINDATKNMSTTQSGSYPDLFAFKINYNSPEDVLNYYGTPLFNGNISETYWRTSSDNVLRKYGYQYDHLNRLVNAIYQRPENTVAVTNSYNENIAYDKNGNITTLVRNGDSDSPTLPLQIDYLNYVFQDSNKSNRLAKVSDLSGSNASSGFQDGSNTDDDYGYDANGNMIFDKNKLITSIKYNHLNLPTEIFFTATKKINYIYNATGVKVQKVVTNGTTVTTTTYLGGFQYENAILKYFPHAEGYVNFDTNVYKYVFNYTDHLGNIRLSYTKDEATGLPKIMEENNYYPFGLKHTNYNTTVLKLRGSSTIPAVSGIYKYKYQGQERQDELGLNWDSFKWRNYDPAIGRFMSIDPIGEKYHWQTNYAFGSNQVVHSRELEGLEAEYDFNYDAEDHTGQDDYTPPAFDGHDRLDVDGVHEEVLVERVVNKEHDEYEEDFFDEFLNDIDESYDGNALPEIIKDFGDGLQKAGDYVTIAGIVLSSTVIFAEVGMPLITIGGQMGIIGTVMEDGVKLAQGDLHFDEAVIDVVTNIGPGEFGKAFDNVGIELMELGAMATDNWSDYMNDVHENKLKL